MTLASIQAFLSYAHADIEKDRTLLEWFGKRLQSEVNGQFPNLEFSIWLDTNLRTGDHWDARIESAIQSSKIFIVPLSANWLASEYCLKELSTFLEIEPSLPGDMSAVCAVKFSAIRDELGLTETQAAAFATLNSRQMKFGRDQADFSRLSGTSKRDFLRSFADDISGIVVRLGDTSHIPARSDARPQVATKPGRRREFSAGARDYEQFDILTTAHLELQRHSPHDTRVLAQLEFLPRVYVKTNTARIEFGIRRAYLDVVGSNRVKLERSSHLRNHANPSVYVSRHDTINSVTVELNPPPNFFTLGDATLPSGPMSGENHLCEVVVATGTCAMTDVEATLSYAISTEGIQIEGVKDGELSNRTKSKLQAILQIAAARHRERISSDGRVIRQLPIEESSS